ncbi:hypothetical protein LAZ67_16002868 [Cordylochernes scorpioides]|uniref:Uncharacterized protein n=1 Tax=Cordylochernes scorpioides TaxID=51811 RepID=A0ABY6LCB5_9ARAC|nr:hypothetical protein LAZ67_16002868 [Cordylochernes scorpioides]
MEQKLKQRICIIFYVKLQISATETFEMLNNDAPKRTTVFEWHPRFKAGRISIEDDPCQGRPKFQGTDENVQNITDLMKENPRTTLLELEQDTGISKTTIGRIVTEDLKLKKTPAKFIPRFLSNEQKLCWLATCEDMLERTDPEWKDKIITGDETWVYGYDPDTKRQSAEWRGQEEHCTMKIYLCNSTVLEAYSIVGLNTISEIPPFSVVVVSYPLGGSTLLTDRDGATACYYRTELVSRISLVTKSKKSLARWLVSRKTRMLGRSYVEFVPVDLNSLTLLKNESFQIKHTSKLPLHSWTKLKEVVPFSVYIEIQTITLKDITVTFIEDTRDNQVCIHSWTKLKEVVPFSVYIGIQTITLKDITATFIEDTRDNQVCIHSWTKLKEVVPFSMYIGIQTITLKDITVTFIEDTRDNQVCIHSWTKLKEVVPFSVYIEIHTITLKDITVTFIEDTRDNQVCIHSWTKLKEVVPFSVYIEIHTITLKDITVTFIEDTRDNQVCIHSWTKLKEVVPFSVYIGIQTITLKDITVTFIEDTRDNQVCIHSWTKLKEVVPFSVYIGIQTITLKDITVTFIEDTRDNQVCIHSWTKLKEVVPFSVYIGIQTITQRYYSDLY